MILIGLSVYTVTTALLVQLVYDVKLHRPVRLLRYVRPAMRSVIPLTLSCIAFIALLLAIISPIELFDFSVWTMLVIVFPAIAVIVLFLGAVFCVTAPAIAIERAGWKGLGRSASLTRSYRLPISGALFLMSVIYFLISTAGSMALVMGMPNDYYSFGPLLMVSLPTTIATVLLAILTSLIYARLRELKEGVSVDHLANVFE
ncbi:hypothetical protein [Roseibium sp.]|uniref:hypothetical protein n=1 Tax=Roseibium sp. TaxID=1936156 RepID=UPI003D09BB40